MKDKMNNTIVIPAIHIATIGLKKAIITMIITRIANHFRPMVLKKTIYFFGILF